MTLHRISIPVQNLKMLTRLGSLLLTGSLVMTSCSKQKSAEVPAKMVVHAMGFGLVADGVTDDGPAIQREPGVRLFLTEG